LAFLFLLPLLTLTSCGVKGKLTHPEQVKTESRSESNRAVGREPVRPQ
jgi:predicted small lipoprotein YifL